MSARPGNSLLAVFLESLAQADDAVKRELAAYLRPYLADSPGRLLDASEKARQLGLHPETLVKMARAGRCRGAIKVGREWRFQTESFEILPRRMKALPPLQICRLLSGGRRRPSAALLRRFAGIVSVRPLDLHVTYLQREGCRHTGAQAD